jgi:hypothetical protein
MYYAQLHRPGKGVYEDHTDEDIDVDFVYWAGFNEDPAVLLKWVSNVNRPGDSIEVWSGELFDDLTFEQDSDAPYCAFEIPLVN